MKKTLLTLLTAATIVTSASTAMAQDHWRGNDRGWDRHDNRDRNGWRRGWDRHPIHYAPRRGVAVRQYVYYPNARAYYAPWNKRWYYRHGNRWVVAQRAPININLGNGINISLGADSPVVYDQYVTTQYRTYYR